MFYLDFITNKAPFCNDIRVFPLKTSVYSCAEVTGSVYHHSISLVRPPLVFGKFGGSKNFLSTTVKGKWKVSETPPLFSEKMVEGGVSLMK